MRVNASALDQLLHPTLDPDAKKDVLTSGLPASPGAAAGEIVFTADDAEAERTRGREVILVRLETSPEDIHGMHAAAGILTARGGMTSHAAVVARGMGRPCVSGAGALRIDAKAGTLQVGVARAAQGRRHHHRRQHRPGLSARRQDARAGAVRRLRHAMGWADAERRLSRARQRRHPARCAPGARVRRRGHRSLPHRAHVLRCRAHPRRAPDDPAEDAAGRRAALAKILPMQRADFEQLFEIMAGLPVTVRLLDPPLHEFLPAQRRRDRRPSPPSSASTPEKLQARVTQLSEFNPMLGFRGCRLAILYPEIPEMQARAVFEAAVAVAKTTGEPVQLGDHGAARRLSAGVRRSCAKSILRAAEAVEKEQARRSTISSAR